MKRDLLITASYNCQPRHLPPVIRQAGIETGGAVGQARIAHLYGRLRVVLGPLYLLYIHLLKWIGVADDPLIDRAEFEALSSEFIQITDHAQYWQAATKRMLIRAQNVRAKGKKFTIPDWFIWLARYDVSIAPARLKAIMTICAVKGRVVMSGLIQQLRLKVRGVIASLTEQVSILSMTAGTAGLWQAQALPD